MHIGTFVFAQIVQFLPQRQFRRILAKYNDRTKGWSMSHWNHLLVLMFGQLMGCGSLRELTDITTAHAKKSKHLGFGHQPINRQNQEKYPGVIRRIVYYALNSSAVSFTTRTTTILEPRTSLSSINTGGKSRFQSLDLLHPQSLRSSSSLILPKIIPPIIPGRMPET